jgi:hypothetical protein
VIDSVVGQRDNEQAAPPCFLTEGSAAAARAAGIISGTVAAHAMQYPHNQMPQFQDLRMVAAFMTRKF